MKSLPLRRWLVCFFFGLFLSAMLSGIQAKAAETAEGVLDNSGILQAGGLLQEDETSMSPRGRSFGNVTGARKALIKALDSIETTVDLTPYQIGISELSSLFSSIINNNPKYFYCHSCRYSYNRFTGQVIYILFEYTDSENVIRSQMKAYEQAVQSVLGNIQPSWSNFEKAMYVNDYLAVNCRYDFTYTRYSAYNVLVEGTAVCQGYALAYEELMGRLGIPCQLVTSDLLDHAWNLVKVKGSWYHVDVTWNDSDPTGDRLGRAGHSYLLKSTKWFRSVGEHTVGGVTDYVYSDGATDSTASSRAYDNYFWNDIDSPFGYYNGYWYANDGGVLYKYKFGSKGMTSSSILKTLNQNWPVFSSGGSMRPETYDGCIVYGSKLYYASPTSIQALELADPDAAEQTVLTLSAAQQRRGYIYGFYIDSDGKLFYGVSGGPEAAVSIYGRQVHTHTYGSWTVTKKVTCTKDGQRKRVCTDCRTVKTELIVAAGHDKKTTTTPATFKKTGKTVVTCKNCNKVLKNKTLAKVKCKKGQTYTVGNYKYKIVSPKITGKGTVSFAGLVKNEKKVTIGDTVKILGVNFRIVQIGNKALKNKSSVTSVTIGKNVTSIGKEAFYGTKRLKTITIKSTKITKVGSNAFKNIYSKAKIKVPKTKLKKYKALMKDKGQKPTVKIS